MTRAKKSVPDTNVCGACAYCTADTERKDNYLCWASPPAMISDDEGYTIKRGLPVGADWPKCVHYIPRLNG